MSWRKLWAVWDLPGPGIEPMSPALVGGFFTTDPPGKLKKKTSYPKVTVILMAE